MSQFTHAKNWKPTWNMLTRAPRHHLWPRLLNRRHFTFLTDQKGQVRSLFYPNCHPWYLKNKQTKKPHKPKRPLLGNQRRTTFLEQLALNILSHTQAKLLLLRLLLPQLHLRCVLVPVCCLLCHQLLLCSAWLGNSKGIQSQREASVHWWLTDFDEKQEGEFGVEKHTFAELLNDKESQRKELVQLTPVSLSPFIYSVYVCVCVICRPPGQHPPWPY